MSVRAAYTLRQIKSCTKDNIAGVRSTTGSGRIPTSVVIRVRAKTRTTFCCHSEDE